MSSEDKWAQFRLGPQRALEKAIDGLYASGLSHDQRKMMHRIDTNYHNLMRIAEGLAGELAAASEEMARMIREEGAG